MKTCHGLYSLLICIAIIERSAGFSINRHISIPRTQTSVHKLHSVPLPVDEEVKLDTIQLLAKKFETLVNSAMREGDIECCNALFSSTASWKSPGVDGCKSRDEIAKELKDANEFFIMPRLCVLDAEQRAEDEVTLSWKWSTTWPTVHRPRLSFTGKSKLKLSDQKAVDGVPFINAVVDEWDTNWGELFSTQFLPKPWDVYHLFLTPPADMPFYKVVERGGKGSSKYEIRDYAPRVVIEGKITDPSNSREDMLAQALPNWIFTGFLRMSGRKPEEYSPTSPTELQITSQLVSSEEEGKDPERKTRVTWRVGTPQEHGLDIDNEDQFPNPQNFEELEEEDFLDAEVQYVLDGWRRIAVTPFNGGAQDIEVVQIRAQLLEQVVEAGYTPATFDNGRPKFSFLQYNIKHAFNSKNQLAVAMYEPRPFFGDGNEVLLELERP
mmetsp:Transcript_4895/g.7383  ORF Transcript_4895/g.7383 Transcript_4895/m.7383 type:complete len:438 (-) Transcript_4895:82-1395(-)